MLADGRQLVNRARYEAQTWKKNYGEHISPETLARHLGSFVHLHTCYWAYRPFGSAVLLAGYDHNLKTHQLYSIDHNGVVQRAFGAAIGKGKSNARTEIEKLDLETLKVKDALKLVAKM